MSSVPSVSNVHVHEVNDVDVSNLSVDLSVQSVDFSVNVVNVVNVHDLDVGVHGVQCPRLGVNDLDIHDDVNVNGV